MLPPPDATIGENNPPDVNLTQPGPAGVSPRVNLIFQRIFGAPGSEPLLIDLLNSVLRPARPIVEVRLLHPVLSPEHHEGRALIVDLVAIDDQGVRVQVEMQTSSHGHLRPRMLLGWAKLYGGQLSAGEGFAALRPVISLWFCDRDALPAPPPGRPEPFHARFEVREPIGGPAFSDHFSLHIIELSRFRAALSSPSPAHRWLHFLAEAEAWQAVPALLHSKPLEAAMTLLHTIRADPKERALYEAYCKQLSIEQTIKDDMAELRAEAEVERARADLAEAALAEERAQAAVERAAAEALRAKLRALGLDPDALG